MMTTPFARGVLTGILAVGGLNSVLALVIGAPLVPGEVRPVAVVNLVVCVAGAVLLYRHERRRRLTGAWSGRGND